MSRGHALAGDCAHAKAGVPSLSNGECNASGKWDVCVAHACAECREFGCIRKLTCLVMQGVLGYVILRPLMTAVGVVAQLLGVYGDGKLRFDCVYLYTTIISNFSQVGTPMWTCIMCRPGLHALSISACLIYFAGWTFTGRYAAPWFSVFGCSEKQGRVGSSIVSKGLARFFKYTLIRLS